MCCKNIVILSLVAMLSLSGCATIEVTGLVEKQNLNFSYVRALQDGRGVSIEDIKSSIGGDMVRMSKYRNNEHRYITPVGTAQASLDIIKAPSNGDYIDLTYQKMLVANNYKDSGEDWVKYSFKVTAIDDGQCQKISMEFPKSIKKGANVNGRLINFANVDELTSDVYGIYSGLRPVLYKSDYVRGEVEVPYPDNAVFANFDRLTQPYSGARYSEIEKSRHFRIVAGSSSPVVEISVFPYRNGSKVVYGYKYEYSISPDCSTTYSKDAIGLINKKIADIAKN